MTLHGQSVSGKVQTNRTQAGRVAGRVAQQRDMSLEEQMQALHMLAAICGLMDAADWLWKNALATGGDAS